jgi:phospholipid/cholesterol/gamma-HCH transport system permease protein
MSTINNGDLLAISPILQTANGQSGVQLSGAWTLANLVMTPKLTDRIKQLATNKDLHWDLLTIDLLDDAAALMIWQAWGEHLPVHIDLQPAHQQLFKHWQNSVLPEEIHRPYNLSVVWKQLSTWFKKIFEHCLSLVIMLGQLLLDCLYLLRHPSAIPWAEISITIYDAGIRALSITALVGFLIGIVLSYLSALQLKMFGAEIYIIPILGLSIIRELGPLLAAILVAGRSGSAMTAQIGIMRVTEELDALAAFGISYSLRLILPKVIALSIILPLLTMWTNVAALCGGMFAAQHTLDIGFQQFLAKLPESVPLVNVFIGVGKSAVFGMAIALIACHFGFRIKPNTESLGQETTNSVVAAITLVIMLDALFAIIFMNVGMP